MAQSLFEALTNPLSVSNVANMDNQTALAVQSLLEQQPITTDTAIPEDDDIFQCGKCKKQFSSLSLFVNHKQSRCLPPLPSLGVGTPTNQRNSAQTSVQLPGNNPNSAFTTSIPARQMSMYNVVPTCTSSLSQISGMQVLADSDLMAYTLDQGLHTALQGAQIQGGNPFLSAMTPRSTVGTQSSTNTVNVFSGTNSAFSTIPGSQIQLQSMSQPQITSLNFDQNTQQYLYKNDPPASQQTHHTPEQQTVVATSQPLTDDQQNTVQTENTIPGTLNTVQTGNGTLGLSKPSPSKPVGTSRKQNQLNIIKNVTMETQDNVSVITVLGANIESHTLSNLPKQQKKTRVNSQTVQEKQEEEKKKHKCQYCEKAFSKNFDLQQHVRSHTGEKPFQCIVCGRAFAQKSNVKKHMATHKVWPLSQSATLPPQTDVIVQDTEIMLSTENNDISTETDQGEMNSDTDKNHKKTGNAETQKISVPMIDNSYVCQFCNQHFTSYYHLKSHVTVHKNMQVYKCVLKTCDMTFNDLDNFLEHIKTHESEMSYRCHMCSKQFQSLYDLGVHQYSHSLYPNKGCKTQPREFKCSKCLNKYSSSEALDVHLKSTNHNFPCMFCDKVYTCERFLRRHLVTHGGGNNFECQICHNSFKTYHYLQSHQLIHTGEKPFKCDICSAAFNRKDKRKRHMMIHEAVKKYKCPFKTHTGCMKAFNRPDKLKAHIITHSGLKPFKCTICTKQFTRRSHLRQHLRGHNNQYNFTCIECGKGFNRRSLYENHQKRCEAVQISEWTEEHLDSNDESEQYKDKTDKTFEKIIKTETDAPVRKSNRKLRKPKRLVIDDIPKSKKMIHVTEHCLPKKRGRPKKDDKEKSITSSKNSTPPSSELLQQAMEISLITHEGGSGGDLHEEMQTIQFIGSDGEAIELMMTTGTASSTEGIHITELTAPSGCNEYDHQSTNMVIGATNDHSSAMVSGANEQSVSFVSEVTSSSGVTTTNNQLY